MSEPVLTLEVALRTDPTAATQLWTDLTDWWLLDDDWSMKMGRTSELERFPAGRFGFRLDNADRRFDALNTSGPYAALTVTTTLTAAVVSTTATTITVASSASLPTDQFQVVIGTETMLVTAGFGTTTLTVERGYASTTAATHLNGATVTWTTPGLLPDRRVRVRGQWNLLTEKTAAPGPTGADIGTWTLVANVLSIGITADPTPGLQVMPNPAGATATVRSGFIPAVEGGLYTASAKFATDSSTPCAVGLIFWNAGGVNITAETYGATVATTPTSRAQATYTEVAPPGTATVQMRMRFTTLTGAGKAYEMGLYPADAAPAVWSAGGQTVDLFNGYIESWQLVWEHPGHGYVDVDAVDATKPLNLARLPQSPYEIEIRKANPTAFWLLADEQGGTTARDLIGTRHGTYAPARKGGEALIVGDTRTGMRSALPYGQVLTPAGSFSPYVDLGANVTLASTWSFTWIGQLPDIPPPTAPFTNEGLDMLRIGDPGVNGARPYVEVGATGPNTFGANPVAQLGYMYVDIGDSTGHISNPADPFQWFGPLPDPAVPHHFGLTFDGSRARLYVDGVLTVTTGPIVGTMNLAPFIGLGSMSMSEPFDTTYQAAALFNGTVASGSFLAHTSDAFTPWTGDLPGTRIGRILDAVRWPAADRDIDTGNTVLGPVESFHGDSALAELQAVEEAEAGAVYVTPAGAVRFRERRAIYLETRSTTPVATFSDNPGVGEYAMGDDVRPVNDDEFLITESRVRRAAEGAGDQVWALPSRSRHFARSRQRTVSVATDADALARAQWDVNLYGTADTRIDALTLRPTVDDSLWSLILTLGIGDRVRLITTPLGSGTQITIDGLIEGRDIKVSKDNGWAVTYRLNPRETRPVWIWGVSRWGVDTRWAL